MEKAIFCSFVILLYIKKMKSSYSLSLWCQWHAALFSNISNDILSEALCLFIIVSGLWKIEIITCLPMKQQVQKYLPYLL